MSNSRKMRKKFRLESTGATKVNINSEVRISEEH